MGLPHSIHFDFDAELPRKLRNAAQMLLLQSPLSVSQQNLVLLAISEISANYIRHSSPAPTLVSLKLEWNAFDFTLQIDDNGGAIEDLEIDELDVLLNSDLQTNGYGLSILKDQFDLCTYNGDADSGHAIKNQWLFKLLVESEKARYKIAIIDDDTVQLSLLELYLQEHELCLFESPLAAFQWLKNNKVDIIISDIHMSELDGISFREHISAITHLALTPFVFLTGDSNESLENGIARFNIDDFILKPIQKNKLVSVIDRVLQQRKSIEQQTHKLLDTDIKSKLRHTVKDDILDGYLISTFTQSADIGGGDCWHVEKLTKGSLGITLCDVMGHDLKSSFNAARLLGALQSSSYHFQTSKLHHTQYPSYLCETINHWLNVAGSDVLTTMQSLSISESGINIINTGGLPPYLITQEGYISSLPITAPLLGLFSSPILESNHCVLKEGERLLLFTDGLVEIANDPKAERERLHDLQSLFNQAYGSRHEMLNTIAEFVTQLPNIDDISLIVIEKQSSSKSD
ncbi:SpoIIE family protein phosphatase [Marinomonas mediterranea]|jgi:Response regulator containing CheY-like receiver, AAA-type ATPase, and DNA-binding domains|uniref:Response regulator receiver modulated protein serine/threonine phosphatase n=1 Tax=Marinomonas mediterranea (strain ATCC 700492 / JCM 21426 / NBRC 103028 / MMB-1) TaxID=717774 RepID=F2K215_MARM1|nr:SpoIIE family protein phosphatase [Marinomonas mediterranea]ADZ90009.1 response regulator receiver modulated protein serine/threonine phosphatase [Marinomonas mediterranea MMB-1]WCN08075.1 SpoIIE family protein phosphatase [Marinomonas mediterranea]WCN16217.1 SpoIIE family protein phosphatase [Marinomonas mediterranea MMB-1]